MKISLWRRNIVSEVTFDRWHVAGDSWQVTNDKKLYWCYLPHAPKYSRTQDFFLFLVFFFLKAHAQSSSFKCWALKAQLHSRLFLDLSWAWDWLGLRSKIWAGCWLWPQGFLALKPPEGQYSPGYLQCFSTYYHSFVIPHCNWDSLAANIALRDYTLVYQVNI